MSRYRAVAFRLAALLIGLSPLALLEAVLAVGGWGEPDPRVDPWVSFAAVRPLFELNTETGRYEIARGRQGYFRPDSFRARKDPREFRVFVLGGSTVQGNPWGIETSFTSWLELNLRAADPQRDWDVINCGGISYASYRVVPILEEVLKYEPDLIVVYTGHNEFLEDREYAQVKRQASTLLWLVDQAARTRTFHWLRYSLLGQPRAGGNSRFNASEDEAWESHAGDDRPQLPAEVAARLDFQGGLAKYHRDDAWREEVERHFEANLRRMAALCHSAQVPLILMNPVCNLRDCPPFKSEHRRGFSSEEQKRWDDLWSEARQRYAKDLPGAVERLRQALAIDDQHGGIHYELAKCCDSLGQVEDARAHYELARELDVCPLRIRAAMNRSVLQVADKTATPCVDASALLSNACRDQIPGDYLLVDHVHPSIKGHQMLADALLDEMVRLHVVAPREGWQVQRDQVFQSHLESLDSFYFLAGQRHLHALRNWAAGRATRLPQQPAD
ncbi:MAG: GDSL-type esterase/lipase family protein [Pirellulales bacterium]